MRKPTRDAQEAVVASGAPPPAPSSAGVAVTRTPYSGWSPWPSGHQKPRVGDDELERGVGGAGRDDDARVGHAVALGRGDLDGDMVLAGRHAVPLERDAGVEGASCRWCRSCRSCRSCGRPSTPTSGRTEAIRTPDHESSPIGRQMPAPATSTPQSQPNELACLRSMLKGWWLTWGRAPWRATRASASATGAAKVTVSAFCPSTSASLHVDAVAAVLVLGPGDDAAVELDHRDGVEALGDEVVAGGPVVVPGERGREAPRGVADPLLRRLGVAVERVGDEAGGEQVGVHLARHGRRDSSAGHGVGHRTGDGLDGPVVVQGGEDHGVPLRPGISDPFVKQPK